MDKRFLLAWVVIPFSAVLVLAGCDRSRAGMAGKSPAGSGTAVTVYQGREKETDFWTRVGQELYPEQTEKTGPQGQKCLVVSTAGDWVYYITGYDGEDPEQEQKLCRAPVKREEKTDTVLFEKEEVLFRSTLFFDVYASDQYVIFIACDGAGVTCCYKLDLSSKKSKALGKEKEFTEDVELITTADGTPLVLGGRLFVTTANGIYVLDPEKERLHRISKVDYSVRMVKCGGSVYFTTDHQGIYRYDGENKGTVCVLDQDTIRKKLGALKLWGEQGRLTDFSIENIFSDQDRLYMDVTANWRKQGKGKKQEKYITEGILLSAPADDIKNIKHENVLFDSLFTMDEDANIIEQKPESIEIKERSVSDLSDDTIRASVSSMTGIGGIVDGRVVLTGIENRPPYVSSVNYLPCLAYDLTTGEIIENPEVEFAHIDWTLEK